MRTRRTDGRVRVWCQATFNCGWAGYRREGFIIIKDWHGKEYRFDRLTAPCPQCRGSVLP